MNKFHERLQQAAKWAGVGESQVDIAASLNLNRQTINRWFQGGEPNASMLLLIARSWGVDPEWLKSGEGDMLPAPDGNGAALSNEERELIKNYRSASSQVRGVIRTMARAVRKSMVVISLAVPPLLAPDDAQAGVLHKNSLTADGIRIVAAMLRRFMDWLSQSPRFAM
jgi:transcriptional regulator with XRE-family HTH domain